MICFSFFFECYGVHRHLHSFPTRRSSDLATTRAPSSICSSRPAGPTDARQRVEGFLSSRREKSNPEKAGDRKSTRLNSSHRCISYAVFCLKKKNKNCQ